MEEAVNRFLLKKKVINPPQKITKFTILMMKSWSQKINSLIRKMIITWKNITLMEITKSMG